MRICVICHYLLMFAVTTLRTTGGAQQSSAISPEQTRKVLNRYLLYAVQQNHLDGVKVMLAKGADANTWDRYHIPVLVCAIERVIANRGKREIVDTLLARGANPNTRIHAANFDKGAGSVAGHYYYPQNATPLMAAVARQSSGSAGDQLEVVKLLLKCGANPNLKADDNRTALQWAESLTDKEHSADIIKVLKQVMAARARRQGN